MCIMKLFFYWHIVYFVTDFVSVECRSPSVNNLFRNRPTTTISPSTEEILHQPLFTTTITSSSLDPTDKNTDHLLTLQVSHSTTAAVKVIPAVIVATVKPTYIDMPFSTNLNSTKVPVVTADAIVNSTSDVRTNKTANITNFSVKNAMNIRDRLLLNNVSRLTVTRPSNTSQIFPKRPLLSPTMSRYLAIAREKALNSTPSPTLLIADKPTHVIAKRHTAVLLSLDDFVLDIDNM